MPQRSTRSPSRSQQNRPLPMWLSNASSMSPFPVLVLCSFIYLQLFGANDNAKAHPLAMVKPLRVENPFPQGGVACFTRSLVVGPSVYRLRFATPVAKAISSAPQTQHLSRLSLP